MKKQNKTKNMFPCLPSKCQSSKWLNKSGPPKPPPYPDPSKFGAVLELGNHLEKDWQTANPGPNQHVFIQPAG